MTNKVATITLNPALDLTGNLNQLNLGSVSIVESGHLHPAGKGVNVAKVLADLGAEVTVTGFLGLDNEEMFCQLFESLGAKDKFVRVKGSTRINVKLVEENGSVSDINFPGVNIPSNKISEFEAVLDDLCEDHEYFVIAGSLPSGISPQLCAKWINLLHQRGKKVLFDSSRDALAAGLDSSPWLIKPNDEELGQFVGRELTSPNQCQEAATAISDKGIENLVVSMGAEGVMWLCDDQWRYAKPPKMKVVSTVGAGDTFVAGMCWGHMQNMDKRDLLTFSTALSALAVSQVGVGVTDINEVVSLQNTVEYTLLSTIES